MRNLAIVSIVGLGVVLAFLPVALAQGPGQERLEVESWPEVTPGPGWKTCPRCQNNDHVEAWRERLQIEGHPFDPKDISGVWYTDDDGVGGINLDGDTVPPFTPYGRQLHAATQTQSAATNDQDGMLICDPLGYPRWFTYNYGNEFIHLPDRVLQFFEWGHAWRTIWTDGREVPEDPQQPRWTGYAVGRWEGDEFIVESSGYDERSWLDQDRRTMARGYPHSDEMRIEERYRRTSYETLETTLTIIDPKVYTAPWTTRGVSYLRPGAEIGEYFCVPSQSDEYNRTTHEKY